MAGTEPLGRGTYLSLYNWIVFIGWFQVLYMAVKTLRESGHEHVYAAVENPLLLAQSAAVLEILHGLSSLIRSPISAMIPQISSRLFLTWGILWNFPEIQSHRLVSFLVISWSTTEIIRYSFFGIKEVLGNPPSWLTWQSALLQIIRYSFFGIKEVLGNPPSWLTWLRYSSFLILYPTGISSEVGLVYAAFLYMEKTGKFRTRMPKIWNVSFDYSYSLVLVLLIYVPGSLHLYTYMLGQRKQALSRCKKE